MKNNKNLILIAPIPNLSNRVRAIKVGQIFVDKNINVSFWGWKREGSDQVVEKIALIEKKIIFKTDKLPSISVVFLYPFWAVIVFFQSLFIPKRTVVWALGLETAFPAVVAAKIKGFKVVFDDADRLVLLKNYSWILIQLIRLIEAYVSKNVTHHIVPNLKRYDYESSSHFELKNTPNCKDFEKAVSLSTYRWITDSSADDLRIYVNGWLTDLRGFNVLNRIAALTFKKNITWVVAGKLGCANAEEFVSREDVIYLGEVSHIEALSIYKYVDYVFTYYDPVIPINRYAESNKWGDAMFFKVPILYNSEIITGDFIASGKFGLAFNYTDIDSIGRYLTDAALKQGIKKSFNKVDISDLPSFERRVSGLVDEIYTS